MGELSHSSRHGFKSIVFFFFVSVPSHGDSRDEQLSISSGDAKDAIGKFYRSNLHNDTYNNLIREIARNIKQALASSADKHQGAAGTLCKTKLRTLLVGELKAEVKSLRKDQPHLSGEANTR